MVVPISSAALQYAVGGFEPFVDLSFPVQGKTLPADHGYGLYAAFVNLIPEIRLEPDIRILTIPGFGDRQGRILLTEQSYLRIRISVSKIPLVYQIAGKRINIGKHEIGIGIPTVYTLCPARILRARIVTIKGKDYTQPEPFITAVERQLKKLNISGKASVPVDLDGKHYRKTIKIQRFTVVGFTTEVSDLSDEDSIKLQQYGVGGKAHMGCGYFLAKGGKNV